MGDTSHGPGDGVSADSGDDRTLTRRDAMGALAAAGATAVAGCSGLGGDDATETPDAGSADAPTETERPSETTATDGDDEESDTTPVASHELATMRSLATVLYPSGVEVTEEFLETYLYGRIADEAAYEGAVSGAVETLDSLAREQYDGAFRTLDTDQQESVIVESDVRSAASVADGTDVERLNYHLVDELLFALYASPTGGELVGNPNPRGWPGGYGDSPEVSE
jgi:hypothetical protein